MDNKQGKIKASPEERVDKMNGIFDRLVLPMILSTVAMFVAFGVIPKLASCETQKPENSAAEQDQADAAGDFYALRTVLLADMEGNRSLFEAAGYTVVQTDDTAEPMAYRELDSGAEIIDNLTDSSGSKYSVIYRTDPETGTETNIMIYGRSIFLVLLTNGEQKNSAVFYNEDFTPNASASDAGQEAILTLVSSAELVQLLEEYKAAMMEVIE